MADEIKVILPDGSVKDVNRGAKVKEIAETIGPGLARDAVAGKLDGKMVDLTRSMEHGGHLKLLTFDDEEGKDVYRHSAAHVMAQAIKRLFDDVQLAIGPPIEDGFYYDVAAPHRFSSDDLEAIEEEMRNIMEEDLPIQRVEISKKQALEFFREKNEPFKVELIQDLPDDSDVIVSYYRQGEFVDLCAGPHLPSTGRLNPDGIKLLNVAGAYWRGDENRPMLQRIYATGFRKEKQLKRYLTRLEEARKRDHRRLGQELDLFSMHEEGGPGLIYWHPKGAFIREKVEDFWRDQHRKRGYDIVYTPHVAKSDLWKTSGHWDWYREDMFSPMEVDGQEYLLKPMNCPFHVLMYQSQTRSYRELPLRWGELGTVYRYERSGVLHGLQRVRGFTQDDAHIFCQPDQLEAEIRGVLTFARFMMETFGFFEYDIALSVRGDKNPDKYIGNDVVWNRAEQALTRAMVDLDLDYDIEEGEAKFYGPAVDIHYKDAIGRYWQGPTIQVDFNLPERFDLTYVGSDGEPHRPVMIHRTVLGSMERFIGCLIEHYGGAFPTWLAPEQVRILPITDRNEDYAYELKQQLEERRFAVRVDDRNEKVGYKIRESELDKIPYMLIVGDREVENKTVSVRTRSQGDEGESDLKQVIERIERDVAERKLEQVSDEGEPLADND